MEELLLLVANNFIENIKALGTISVLWNIIFGLLISVIASFCLLKSAGSSDSYFTFRKTEVFPTSFWLVLGVVLIAPPFPLKQDGILELLSIAICFVVLAITSVMDEKSGMFTLGYLLVGILLEIVIFIIGLITKQIVFLGIDYATMFVCVFLLMIFGKFCYSMGDAGLLLMAGFTCVNCFKPPLWVVAIMIAVLEAMLTFVLRYVLHIKEIVKKKEIRLPFTLHIFIGVLVTFFLFY